MGAQAVVTRRTNEWWRSILRLGGGLLFAGLLVALAPANAQADGLYCEVECTCATIACGGGSCDGYCDEPNGTCHRICGVEDDFMYCHMFCPEG